MGDLRAAVAFSHAQLNSFSTPDVTHVIKSTRLSPVLFARASSKVNIAHRGESGNEARNNVRGKHHVMKSSRPFRVKGHRAITRGRREKGCKLRLKCIYICIMESMRRLHIAVLVDAKN